MARARASAATVMAITQTAVIVGAGDVGQLVARKLLRHPEYGIKLVGFVDAPPKRWRADVADVPVLGVIDDLASIVRELAVDRVIVAFSRQNDQDTLALVRPLAGLNVHVDVVSRMFEMVGPRAGLLDVEGIPLVSISPRSSLGRRVASEARDRRRRSERRVDLRGAAVPVGGVADPAGVARAGVLPSDPPRGGHAGVHDAQVPHDDGCMRISPRTMPISRRP